MTAIRAFIATVVLALAACSNPLPSAGDMQKFYGEAEKRAQKDIDRLAEKRNRGEISPEDFQQREAQIRESIPKRASEIAWAQHELVESELRTMGIPTGGNPVQLNAPGSNGMGDSFYRAANRSNAYQNSGTGYGFSGGTLSQGATPGMRN